MAEIFGVSQNLDCTSSGHYLIPLYDHDIDINSCLIVNNQNESEDRKVMINYINNLHTLH